MQRDAEEALVVEAMEKGIWMCVGAEASGLW
jgi:hypothetical protein